MKRSQNKQNLQEYNFKNDRFFNKNNSINAIQVLVIELIKVSINYNILRSLFVVSWLPNRSYTSLVLRSFSCSTNKQTNLYELLTFPSAGSSKAFTAPIINRCVNLARREKKGNKIPDERWEKANPDDSPAK